MPTVQGLVVGCKLQAGSVTALVTQLLVQLQKILSYLVEPYSELLTTLNSPGIYQGAAVARKWWKK